MDPEKPTLWEVSISATVRGVAEGGAMQEARVTIPVHSSRVPQDIIDAIIALAAMPLKGDQGGDWD